MGGRGGGEMGDLDQHPTRNAMGAAADSCHRKTTCHQPPPRPPSGGLGSERKGGKASKGLYQIFPFSESRSEGCWEGQLEVELSDSQAESQIQL